MGFPIENPYMRNLVDRVLAMSKSDLWDSAVCEWDIYDCEEDRSRSLSCICGKEKLRYLYTIRNRYNRQILFPIGSSCIKKFGREDMNEEVSVTEGMFRLLHAIRNNEFIQLTSDYFSRRLLEKLYEDGVFLPNMYNRYDGFNDYQFLLDMFNKRDKSRITANQLRKIRGLIGYTIRPYLEEQLADKIRE